MADMIREAGSIAAAVAALAGLVILFARLRPVRWLARELVGDPVTAAFRREVSEVVDEKLNPIRSDVDQFTRALRAHLDAEMGVQEQIEARLGAIESRIPAKEDP